MNNRHSHAQSRDQRHGGGLVAAGELLALGGGGTTPCCRTCAPKAAGASSRSPPTAVRSPSPATRPTTPPSGASKASAKPSPRRVAPFGIGVTIVEPGGARTEFRYGSAPRRPPSCPPTTATPPTPSRRCSTPPTALSPATRPAWPPASSTAPEPEPAPLRMVLGSQALQSTTDALRGGRRLRDPGRTRRLHRLSTGRVGARQAREVRIGRSAHRGAAE